MSGYELKSWIEEYLGFFWSEGWGQIYPALHEMERRGLISLQDGGAEHPKENKTKRPRKVYAITEAGKASLTRYLGMPPEDAPLRNELVLKVFFGSVAGADVVKHHMEAELAKQRAMLAGWSEMDRAIDAAGELDCNKKDARYWKYALRFGAMYNAFVMKWCESVLADMGKKENTGGK